MNHEKIYWPTLEQEAREQLDAMPWWKLYAVPIAFALGLCAVFAGCYL